MFYTGTQFPDRYKNGAFIAFHGSTNRSPYPQAGYIVAFIPFEKGKPKGNWEVFADGFTGKDLVKEMADSKYRPMGLAQGPDGSLFISESRNGKTWRVIFNGNKLDYGQNQLDQMEKLKEKSYLRIPDKELDLLSQK